MNSISQFLYKYLVLNFEFYLSMLVRSITYGIFNQKKKNQPVNQYCDLKKVINERTDTLDFIELFVSML